MFKNIKESFKITNKYLVHLATPVVLFSFFSSLYIVFSVNGGNKYGLLFSLILFFLMLGAFLSGWLYMTSNSVKNADLDDNQSLITEFPSGVGEYFLPMLGYIFNIAIISGIFFFAAQLLGNYFIGDVGITVEALKQAQTSPEAAKLFYNSLSDAQIISFMLWSLLSFSMTALLSFLFMFYSPAIMYKTKNPFKALFTAFKDLFSSKFFKNIGLFIILIGSYFLLFVISSILSFNLFMQFVMNLINFYYAVFITVLVYNYYYSNFVKIGSNIDVNV